MGRDTQYWNGNGEAALREVGWFGGNSGFQMHAVTEAVLPGSVEAHPLGLLGLHCNAWKWCHDQWDPGTYRRWVDGDIDVATLHWFDWLKVIQARASATELAALLQADQHRMLRGGCYRENTAHCRPSHRHRGHPTPASTTSDSASAWSGSESAHGRAGGCAAAR